MVICWNGGRLDFDLWAKLIMDERELAYGEAVRALAELFSDDPSARGCRKYVLEYQDGELAFRFAEVPSKPTPPRDEINVALDEVSGIIRTGLGW